ncbi:MAG: CDP-alcohol phosphatidyltransferase family protein [Verrucomicrobiales bacterium]
MNLPNQLTVARLIMTLVFVAAMALELSWSNSAALLLFIAASITDWLDRGDRPQPGARSPRFGKLMDPLADKVLMCSAFVMLSIGAVSRLGGRHRADPRIPRHRAAPHRLLRRVGARRRFAGQRQRRSSRSAPRSICCSSSPPASRSSAFIAPLYDWTPFLPGARAHLSR